MLDCEPHTNGRTRHRYYALATTALLLIPAACGPPNLAKAVPEGARPGDLALAPCAIRDAADRDTKADCGTLVVREESAKADSRLIALPVVRIHASTGGPAVPVFWLGGGPGQSNMTFRAPSALLRNHDVVLVGYRGVDGSSTLDCPEYARALRLSAPLSAGSLSTIAEAMTRCLSRLQHAGVDVSRYTIGDVVTDMEAARHQLGYDSVNLLSASYGTRVAQIYGYLHPHRIHRSVMVGVNPPGRFVWEPHTADAQLEYYAHLCARDPSCSARTADLAETVREVLRDMPRRWLFVRIDADKVKVTTFALLFHRRTAAMVFDAYLAAARGDPSGLALLSIAYDLLVPRSMNWGDLYTKATTADLDTARNYREDMNPPDAVLGAPLSLLLWGGIDAQASHLPPLPDDLRRAQRSGVQTLLVSGTVDFSTPAHVATAELLPYLASGRQVVLSEFGHTADLMRLQPRATERLLTSFYDTGLADTSLFTYAAMDFHASPRLSTLAKVILGLLATLAATSLAAICILARWVHHRWVGRRFRAAA